MNFKKYYVPQLDEVDCGASALAMIFKYYNSDIAISKIRELAKTDQNGTTALGLKKVSENFNFNTLAIQADMELFEQEDMFYPFIAHVIKNERLLHYYVVYGTEGDDVLVADPDPLDGIRKISKDTFSKEWSGVALFITPNTTYKPISREKNGNPLINLVFAQKRIIIDLFFASLIITLINIAGTYFLQTIIDTYVPNAMWSTLYIISIGLVISYVFQQVLEYADSKIKLDN